MNGSVRGLLAQALYTSMFDEVLQPIPPSYMSIALTMLNYVLDTWRDKIPYDFTFRFNSVDELEDTNFVQVDVVSYILNNTKITLKRLQMQPYQEQTPIENLTGYPQEYWFDESTQTIHVYPRPSNPDYQFEVQGRTALGDVTMDSLLPANMPKFMQWALIYELAFMLCGRFGTAWNEQKEQARQTLLMQLDGKQVMNLKPQTRLAFGNKSALPFPFFYYLSGGNS